MSVCTHRNGGVGPPKKGALFCISMMIRLACHTRRRLKKQARVRMKGQKALYTNTTIEVAQTVRPTMVGQHLALNFCMWPRCFRFSVRATQGKCAYLWQSRCAVVVGIATSGQA